MADPDSGVAWDDTVDAICVGTSPGVLAYAVCCAAHGLDVLLVHPPDEPDQQTAAWYAAMTEDLTPTVSPGREYAGEGRQGFSFERVAPMPEPTGKRVKLEPFVGEHLRQWSAHCSSSPLGVMLTEIPELLVPMRTEDGATITAAFLGEIHDGDVLTWLADRAREVGIAESDGTMSAMVLEEGRIAGVELDDGTLVATTGGLAFPVAAEALVPDVPGLGGSTVAIVGRPAGRFARVDLLQP